MRGKIRECHMLGLLNLSVATLTGRRSETIVFFCAGAYSKTLEKVLREVTSTSCKL